MASAEVVRRTTGAILELAAMKGDDTRGCFQI